MDEVERAQVQSSRRGLETRAADNPLAGFIPWIIFWVVASSPSTWEYGAIGAALAAVILALPSVSRRRPKILDIATIVFFVAVAVIGAVVGAEDRDWLDRWSMVLSSGALGLIALGSLAFVPFTEQYAREQAPPELWGNRVFRRINRVLTLVWGLAFLATAVLGYIAVITLSTSDWTNWILPIVLIVGAFKFTARYPQRAGARAARCTARSRE
jgi:uncharacterized membrane protein YfcA